MYPKNAGFKDTPVLKFAHIIENPSAKEPEDLIVPPGSWFAYLELRLHLVRIAAAIAYTYFLIIS